jgi:hypothetical protein
MPRLKNPERAMVTVLGVRLTAEESARVDAVVKAAPIATRHRVARVALLYGLAAIERDPGVLLLDPAGPTKPKAKKVARRRAS